MTEMFDIYDDAMRHIGTKPRADVHRDGDWHRTFHCWVIYRGDDGQDWVVIQKRVPDKDIYPNCLDISSAGHYEAGETVADGVREIQEELGLVVAFDDLIPVGQRVNVAHYDNILDRQVSDVFLYICNQPLRDYAYQKSEIAVLIALNVETGLQLLTGEIDTLTVPAIGFDTPTITIARDDFIPTQDNYFAKALVLAKRCLDGEKYLFI
ncbi:MAG: NUDIX domain-containing protein [Chloroflexota bacterium]